MQVKAWKNGPLGSIGLIFGIRVGAKNARQFFDKKWRNVVVEFGQSSAEVKLSRSFWEKSPELRHTSFEGWLRGLRIVPWKPHKPPILTLTPLGGNRFRLTRT